MVKERHKTELCNFLLGLGDDVLILGQQLSKWCGHGPTLEEDLALSNIALDYFGQSVHFLRNAGIVEGEGRDEDSLAYHRETIEFRNCLLVEQPGGDFGKTILRIFLFSSYFHLYLDHLKTCSFQEVASLSDKVQKEVAYHLRHSAQWVLRLGDGTEESHKRMLAALEELWRFTGELFSDEGYEILIENDIVPSRAHVKDKWQEFVFEVLIEASLPTPDPDSFMQTGGRLGQHSEHLGHLLSDMQILPRSYPDAEW